LRLGHIFALLLELLDLLLFLLLLRGPGLCLSLLLLFGVFFFLLYPCLLLCFKTSQLLFPLLPLLLLLLKSGESRAKLLLFASCSCSGRFERRGGGLSSRLCFGFGGLCGLSSFGGASRLLLRGLDERTASVLYRLRYSQHGA
jgi:hypothetical protein